MDHPQSGRSRAPVDRREPAAGRYRAVAADGRYAPQREPGPRGWEGSGSGSGFDRHATEAERPTAGYYSPATPQRTDPPGRARVRPSTDRTAGSPSGYWADPYPDERSASRLSGRTPTRTQADDDWDTHVFSLLPSRTSTTEPRDQTRPSNRADFLDEAADPEAPAETDETRTEARLACQVAAIASLAAGVIHVFATPTHWQEWPVAGAFFAATAGFQLLWGLLALRIGNGLFGLTGIAANLGFLGLWAASRQWGVPFGPHAGVPEAYGAADLIAAAMEVAIVVGLLWALLPRERHGVLSAGGYRAAIVLAIVVLGAMAFSGSSAALQHSHSHDAETAGPEDDGHHHDHGADEESADPSDSEATADEASTEPAEEDHTHAPGEEHD
jgi:hypothetical protein